MATALKILAIVVLAGTAPLHAAVVRRRPQDLGLHPDGLPAEPAKCPTTPTGMTLADAWRQGRLGWLAGAFAANMAVTTVVFVLLVPFLVGQGAGPLTAAAVLAFVGLASLPGRVGLTLIGGRWSRHRLTAAVFGLQALALAELLVFRTGLGPWIFAGVFGVGYGAITPSRAALVAEQYGTVAYARINSVVGLFLTAARASAPLAAALLGQASGGYGPVFASATVVSLAAAALLMRVGSGTRRAGASPDAAVDGV